MSVPGLATIERQAAALQRQIRDIVREQAALDTPVRNAVDLAAALGLTLDPWQREALTSDRKHIVLLVSRQGGKGMVASLLALDMLLNQPGSTTVIVSRADRQAKRLLRRIRRLYRLLSNTPPVLSESAVTLELRTGSELLALPGSEETIRGIEAVDLLIVDEAALVPDDLHAAVRPFLATTDGREVLLSTPRGRRGFFYYLYTSGSPEWHRVKVTAPEIPRIKPTFLERERRDLGDWMYRQEYLCEFLDTDDQVFASDLIARAFSPDVTPLFAEAA